MYKSNKKVKVAALSVVSNTTLIILKVIAGILSGSVSIISEAIHSGVDLIASIIAFYSVRISAKPADENHPYGHGKIENVSGVIEGLLIFAAAVMIIIESIKKLFHPAEMGETSIAIAVMFFSALVNAVVSNILYKVARQEDSVALEADALHLKTDVYTSIGVALGLILIKLTGISILDPIVAIVVAGLILKEAWELTGDAFSPLLDTRLSDGEEQQIKSIISNYQSEFIDFHNLRTRKSGHIKYIDFHLRVNENLTVKASHDLCDKIQHHIDTVISNANVHIHIDPGNEQD